jgi:hypothetical protein
MGSSERKKAANRENGKKGKGPKNTAHTRYNATKHALTAKGVTDRDEAEGLRRVLADCTKILKPSNELTAFLVETAALQIVRARRARRYEAEYIVGLLHPPKYVSESSGLDDLFKGTDVVIKSPTLIDPGLPPSIDVKCVEKLVNVFARYESGFVKGLFQALHEYERLNRIGEGEHVPASGGAVDVAVLGDSEALASAAKKSGKRVARNDGESGSTSGIDARNVSQPVSTSAELPESLLPAKGNTLAAADRQNGGNTPPQAPWSPGYSPGPLWRK